MGLNIIVKDDITNKVRLKLGLKFGENLIRIKEEYFWNVQQCEQRLSERFNIIWNGGYMLRNK